MLAAACAAAILSASGAKKQEAADWKRTAVESVNEETARAHIGFLAADEFEGREAGYAGGRLAGKYCEAYLRSLGLPAAGTEGYGQPFEAYRTERQKRGRYTVHPDSIARLREGVHQRLPLRNVLAKIEGKRADEYVVVGAHFDHIGMDPLLDGDKIYNGADDNASGVAAVLQIARALKESGIQPERTIIFALWDGEEKGLLGSEYFMQTWGDPKRIKGYLNFDMIGRNNDESRPEHVVYFYTEAHPAFEQWLRRDIEKYGLRLQPDYRAWDRPIGGGDNGSFAKRDVPVIWYHTDGHPDYHMPGDHANKINYPKTVDITRAALLNVIDLANAADY